MSEMFNKKVLDERIRDLKKNDNITAFKDVESLLLRRIRQEQFETSYDVMAEEMPYFRTLNYTEHAGTMIVHPLNSMLRVWQMEQAFFNDDDSEVLDYAGYIKSRVEAGQGNKYQDRENFFDKYPPRKHIVILAGSNKIKERQCLNKLRYIHDTWFDDVYFKPHPVTNHTIIGEIKDLFGQESVLPREADVYQYIMESEVVHTTHLSETATTALCLGKEIDTTDVWQDLFMSSFYHINKFVFEYAASGQGIDWINKTFSSYKSGVFCPQIDPNWRLKMDKYLEFIRETRNSYKNWYIEVPRKK
tara:strand:+ start:2538 stop:3446 length:909 start_codon:yes stop_codon:yes gene_type:complete